MNIDKFIYLFNYFYLARLLLTVSMRCSLAKLAPWRKGPYIWSKGKIQGSRRATKCFLLRILWQLCINKSVSLSANFVFKKEYLLT